MRKLFKRPIFHLTILMILFVIMLSFSTIHMLDDGFYYQQFAEKIVNEGKIDFSIPGFQGPSFFAAIVYFFTRSSHSINYFENLIALLTTPIIYLAIKEMFNDKFKGVLASYIYFLMPFINLTGLRGWSWTSTTFFTFLTIYLLYKKPQWSWLSWGLAMIIKAFPVALLPLFIYKKRYQEILLAALIPIVYIAASFIQTGGVYIGAHPDFTLQQLIDPWHLPANMAFAFQNYFSIHNYTPFNPIHPGDMIHFSPFITFFAVLAVVYFKKYFADKKLFYALLAFSAIAFIIPGSFYYYDRYYFTLFDISLIILALAVIPRYKLLLPLVALSFGFQFYYFYMEYKDIFWPDGNRIIFLAPLIVVAISIIYLVFERKKLFVA